MQMLEHKTNNRLEKKRIKSIKFKEDLDVMKYYTMFKTVNVVKYDSLVGKITVAIVKRGDIEHMQFAFCSPKDRYDKKLGQLKAYFKTKSKDVIMLDSPITRDIIKRKILDEAYYRDIRWMKGIESGNLR